MVTIEKVMIDLGMIVMGLMKRGSPKIRFAKGKVFTRRQELGTMKKIYDTNGYDVNGFNRKGLRYRQCS